MTLAVFHYYQFHAFTGTISHNKKKYPLSNNTHPHLFSTTNFSAYTPYIYLIIHILTLLELQISVHIYENTNLTPDHVLNNEIKVLLPLINIEMTTQGYIYYRYDLNITLSFLVTTT